MEPFMISLASEIDELKHDTKILPTQIPPAIFRWIVLAVALISLGLLTYTLITIRKMNKTLNDQSFSQMASQYANSTDLLSPDVGVIQFMKRGYTVQFDSVSYTPNGMEISGLLGNPTQLTLSGINLTISARPYLYQVKDKVEKNPMVAYTNDFEIGSAQTSIHYLAPGKTVSFSMTIPNVKQTKDGLQLAVSFANSDYSYGY
jgi:hypothetical protein